MGTADLKALDEQYKFLTSLETSEFIMSKIRNRVSVVVVLRNACSLTESLVVTVNQQCSYRKEISAACYVGCGLTVMEFPNSSTKELVPFWLVRFKSYE